MTPHILPPHTLPGHGTVLLSHPSVAAMPSLDLADPLVGLAEDFGPNRARVRSLLASRLETAQLLLPDGISLRVVEGFRDASDQQRIIDRYSREIAKLHPDLSAAEKVDLTSRFVSPIEVAPHVAGAAVDLTLVDEAGEELDMGTAIDATPEQSQGACYFHATNIGAEARLNRDLLAGVLGDVGCINYPTEWWHWSFGDKYWALLTGASAALYGPVGTTATA
jgi:D-alanyl-D-alanine dipeptidase